MNEIMQNASGCKSEEEFLVKLCNTLCSIDAGNNRKKAAEALEIAIDNARFYLLLRGNADLPEGILNE